MAAGNIEQHPTSKPEVWKNNQKHIPLRSCFQTLGIEPRNKENVDCSDNKLCQ
jgi:hypothetical protein